jgi:hypothetical protein
MDANALSIRMREIVEQLGADRVTLLSSIAGLEEKHYRWREREGNWCIAEVLEHLALAHETTERLLKLILLRHLEANGKPCETDTSVLNLLNRRAIVFPEVKVQAPDRVRPSGQVSLAESLSRLESSKARVLELLPDLSGYDLYEVSVPHPLLGDFNGYQWLLMLGMHEARHAVQVHELRSRPHFPA